MKEQKQQSRDFEQQSIPAEHRRGFWSMFVIMMGFTFFSASMFTGAAMGTGLTLQKFIIALLVGNLFLGVYTGLLAYAASRTQLSIHLLSHYAFGSKGSYIPSAVLAITQIGWFGVGVAMFALPTVAAVKPLLADGSWFAEGDRLLWTIVIISGAVMTSTAYWGIKALRIISKRRQEEVSMESETTGVRLLAADNYVDYADQVAVKLQQAILSLPPKQQLAFNMRYYDELGFDEIARVADSTPTSIKASYHIAKEKIIKYMNSND